MNFKRQLNKFSKALERLVDLLAARISKCSLFRGKIRKAQVKKSFPLSFAVLASIFILSSGWTPSLHPLKPIAGEMLPTFSIKDRNIFVVAKAMTPNESKRNFGHDLPSRGVQPVQLTIQNNTSYEYSLCQSSIDLPSIEPKKVAFKVTKGTIPRSIGYKIAGFLFWPFMIPGTIDGIRVLTHHKNLKKDLLAKSVKDEVVAPYSTFHRVLFVPKEEYKNSFKVTLIELESLKATEFQANAD